MFYQEARRQASDTQARHTCIYLNLCVSNIICFSCRLSFFSLYIYTHIYTNNIHVYIYIYIFLLFSFFVELYDYLVVGL